MDNSRIEKSLNNWVSFKFAWQEKGPCTSFSNDIIDNSPQDLLQFVI